MMLTACNKCADSLVIYKIQKGQICTTIIAPTIQSSQKVELEILKGQLFALPKKSVPFLQVVHQIAIEVIFQTPKTQHFFILLLQATKNVHELQRLYQTNTHHGGSQITNVIDHSRMAQISLDFFRVCSRVFNKVLHNSIFV